MADTGFQKWDAGGGGGVLVPGNKSGCIRAHNTWHSGHLGQFFFKLN